MPYHHVPHFTFHPLPGLSDVVIFIRNYAKCYRFCQAYFGGKECFDIAPFLKYNYLANVTFKSGCVEHAARWFQLPIERRIILLADILCAAKVPSFRHNKNGLNPDDDWSLSRFYYCR